MEARNRNIRDWYGKVQRGEIKLPRFQRFEAWDQHRIASLIQTVIQNLPLGITLILEVGEAEQFISRYLKTAPETPNKVYEHLLDGQQRLTALWRALHNNYTWTTYFIYVQAFDNYNEDKSRDLSVHWKGRYIKQRTGERFPLWCDKPDKCLQRGLIPTHLLRPEDIQSDIDDWLNKALPKPSADSGMDELQRYFELRQRVSDQIKDLRAIVANYNLPYLALPAHTDKAVALNVFINMNTNSKPLSTYDIIVAEVESVMERSLHDLETELHQRHPHIARYAPLSDLILTTAALLQGDLPNQKGAWNMDKKRMVEDWDTLERGLDRMAEFLNNEGIYDAQRLPTNAVLAVIASLYANIPDAGDKRGRDELLLKQYLWRAFFTDRYENSAPTHAFADFNALKKIITNRTKEDTTPYSINDVPIFANHSLVEVEEILTAEWPKRATIRGRGVLAVLCRLGALDFATGERLDSRTIENRHYHHVYPDALLKEAGIPSFLALNCALIKDNTNLTIGRKDPLKYLKDRYMWTSEAIVQERLQAHLIPISELANGGYEGLSDEEKTVKLKQDFDAFLRKRADLVMAAVNKLIHGRQLSPSELYSEV
ncbi:DUF262 domain-containing protein [Stenomitos frigidus]|uniref:DUF262 domain-containing protein n=1 Tax=Stenomitos frigidus TaxID=1886765 RepID=UPI001C6302BE|nr:DUF262 domain-containing protein [Stenomitos frigidus]